MSVKRYLYEWITESKFFRVYILPGVVFQSVVIAGGYGTGRELVEFFLKSGPTGGLYGMFLITVPMWAAIFALSFEFARVFKAYDYRRFFKNLLWKFWPAYEILYILLLLLVLAVIGSAAGAVLRDAFGIPYMLGVVAMFIAVGLLTYYGSKVIATFLSWWSFVLYFVYIVFFVVGFSKLGGAISANIASGKVEPIWALNGFKYALYNLGVIPAILFAINYIETRRQAIASGIIAAIIGVVPGFLFYLVISGLYPDVLPAEVPAQYALGLLGIPFLLGAWMLVLFGTLIETGTGMIHAINERINSYLLDRKGTEMSPLMRAGMAVAFLVIGLSFSTFGLIPLIAQGYGTMSWGFFALHVIPLFTIGIVRILKPEWAKDFWERA